MRFKNQIYTGFYLYPNYEEKLRNIDNPRFYEISEIIDDYSITDAHLFFKGICHIFAYVLNQEFKYEIYELYSENDDYCHHFCMSKLNNVDLYIDVRGITSDEKKFAEFFGLNSAENRKKVTNLEFDDNYYKYSIEFAKYVIDLNFDYYIDKIIL